MFRNFDKDIFIVASAKRVHFSQFCHCEINSISALSVAMSSLKATDWKAEKESVYPPQQQIDGTDCTCRQFMAWLE